MNNIRVILINPSPRNMSLVQPVVSLFYSILKQNDIDMKFFDTTYYDVSNQYPNPDNLMAKNLSVKQYSGRYDKVIMDLKPGSQLLPDFRRTVENYKPHVIMSSAVESTFLLAVEMLKSVRDFGLPHVLGGVFATSAPELALSYDEIDIAVCGEAERIIVPLLEKLARGQEISGIPNVWLKNSKGAVKSPSQFAPLINLDDNPRFDATIYEESRFYRAMGGKIYKMFPIETHRGCTQKCTFCNSPAQETLYKELTAQQFFRKRSINRVMEDIRYAADEMGAEYFFFWADNFMLYSNREIDEFCEAYADIKLPFYVQTYPTTIKESKIEKLVSVGLHRVGMGIEHGNEEFREKVIKRKYSNDLAVKGVEVLKKYNIQYSCNNILGFPNETPELHNDTVLLCRRLLSTEGISDFAISIFTPYQGTVLRELSIKEGFLKADAPQIAPSYHYQSILDMPQFSRDKISGKARTFNLYLRFPKNRWRDVAKAESLSPEGDRILSELRQEYIEMYG